MRMSLTEFRASLVDQGLALSTQFAINFSTGETNLDKIISLAAHTCEIPGVTFQTTTSRRYGVGPEFTYPTTNAITPVSMNFYVDEDGRVMKFFQDWANTIFALRPPVRNEDVVAVEAFYNVAYKRDYVKDIEIILYKRTDKSYGKYKLINAWPLFVGTIQVSWQGESQVLSVPVQFNYDYYEPVHDSISESDKALLAGRESQDLDPKTTGYTTPRQSQPIPFSRLNNTLES